MGVLHDFIQEIFDPTGIYWPWVFVALILFVSGLASTVILWSSKHAIRAMAKEASKHLSNFNYDNDGVGNTKKSIIETTGESSSQWIPGKCIVKVVKKEAGSEHADVKKKIENDTDLFVGYLIDQSFSSDDINIEINKLIGDEDDKNEYSYISEITFLTDTLFLKDGLKEIFIKTGFRESKDESRREIRTEDLIEICISKAWKNAVGAMETIAEISAIAPSSLVVHNIKVTGSDEKSQDGKSIYISRAVCIIWNES